MLSEMYDELVMRRAVKVYNYVIVNLVHRDEVYS